MILIKGKQYFWSQLLLGIMTIFALPITQDLEPLNISDNYSKEQKVIQQIYQTTSKIQQVQQQQSLQLCQIVTNFLILFQIIPLFLTQQFYHQRPIRAGPLNK